MNNVDFQNSVILVEEVLKKSKFETTEIVYVNSPEGKRVGPYIRKSINTNSGLGKVYKQIFESNNVSCENIPNIYSVWENGSKLFVIEEFIKGQNLDVYISQQSFTIEKLSDIFVQLCNAIRYLHENFSPSIIHRDIKPSNILITSSGQVKMIDFGIARNYEKNAQNDTYKFGTVGYASPEQFGFSQTDIRSDIYSLGKVLQYLCDFNNWKSSKLKVSLNQFKDVINKSCSLDPDDRYQSVSLLLKDFNKNINFTSNNITLFIGHVWNILLSLLIIFFVVVVFATVFDPSNSNYQMTIWEKCCYCFMMIVFILFGVWAIFTYKPSLRKIFKKIPRFKFLHYLIFSLICISGVTICALLAQLF